MTASPTLSSPAAPPAVSRGTMGVLAVLALAGAGAFIAGLATADPARTWAIYLVNLVFWSGLSAAGPAIVGIMELMEARWGANLKRLATTTVAFMPVSFVLLLLLFAGAPTLYPWIHEPLPAKAPWLNAPFFIARNGASLLALYTVSLAFARAVHRDEPRERRVRLAVAMLFLYVITLSLFGFDLVMSLAPEWYSALFGGFFVGGSLYAGFTFLVVLTALRSRGRPAGWLLPPPDMQDLAKLCFATSILWMYLFWSQYLVIWYGNIPEEVTFLRARFFHDPWRVLSFIVLVGGWLVPFGYYLKRLTGRPPLRHGPLVGFATLGLVAVWLERFVLVVPSVAPAAATPLTVSDLLITAGFFALFALAYRLFTPRLGLTRLEA
ncbi:MAG: hypothetical protein HYY19_04965 [Candidatus Rokubacteria bacterium]|nr:hypothetical protein [Candidatus Rokubacteria bacterium]